MLYLDTDQISFVSFTSSEQIGNDLYSYNIWSAKTENNINSVLFSEFEKQKKPKIESTIV